MQAEPETKEQDTEVTEEAAAPEEAGGEAAEPVKAEENSEPVKQLPPAYRPGWKYTVEEGWHGPPGDYPDTRPKKRHATMAGVGGGDRPSQQAKWDGDESKLKFAKVEDNGLGGFKKGDRVKTAQGEGTIVRMGRFSAEDGTVKSGWDVRYDDGKIQVQDPDALEKIEG